MQTSAVYNYFFVVVVAFPLSDVVHSIEYVLHRKFVNASPSPIDVRVSPDH